ncbi:zinc-ribbon domain-containing protein [Sphingorhabdus sp. Alg239-R122]|uniref:MJ0042-type zinc finger domain-containing protein n=1 Tax=Sphingorhabdus sp. Alg239-R122 TaxID=2305989 RepID=UPI0013DA62F3|nr:zinc-ribbon domain-containing protein [Sphingorhabdus sp. Alg239-R122]
MIIACPACHTKYAVPDNAIGIDGRTVRCAKCQHSWFQEGAPVDVAPPPADSAAQAPSEPQQQENETEHPDPVKHVEADETAGRVNAKMEPEPAEQGEADIPAPAPSPPVQQPAPEPVDADTGEIDAVQEERAPSTAIARPRRNPARLWTILAIGFALLAALTIGAVSYFGLPGFLGGGATFAEQEPDLIIEFPVEKQERRRAPSGTEYFAASGTVVNTGTTTQKVPDMLIVLRDARGRIVYNWEVKAPVDELGPGERANFNEAVVDIPRSATVAEIGWSPSG